MELNKILQGDCLDVLKTLPDKSVNCCVTSPPYYGLRDYGTGTWVGGDPNCNHYRASKLSKTKTNIAAGQVSQLKSGIGVGDAIYKKVCPLCGATREDKQVGLEETPEDYVARLTEIFTEVRRVLTDDGTLWVNIGDTYMSTTSTNRNFIDDDGRGGNNPFIKKNTVTDSLKVKDLIGIPWMLAFSLRNSGWYLRQDIIWHKPNPMPEPVKDRCTKCHEYIFLLSKSPKYYFDHDAIQEPVVDQDRINYACGNGKLTINADRNDGDFSERSKDFVPDEIDGVKVKNKRSVWSVSPSHYKESHFATFPIDLIKPMILAGCPKGGVVLDPFMGSGTTAIVAKQTYRNYVGIELNPEYVKMAEDRIANTPVSIQLFDIDASSFGGSNG